MLLQRSVSSAVRPHNQRPKPLPSRGVACRAAGDRKQLPIFPLNVVALPCATVPLMIFEARYRVLFNTLLHGADGVEEGLVQKDSPFCGTRRFGMCYLDNESRLAAIGTELQIIDFAHVQDGRVFVTSKGRERFKITKIVKEKPVLIAEVEELAEDDASPETAQELAKEVADLLRSTIRLNVKMNAIPASEDQLEPEELAELGPRDLSYWIASFFSDVKFLQQTLLEEDDTIKRLTKERDILADTVKYYSATVALKSAFNGNEASAAAGGDNDDTKSKDS